MCQVAPGTGGTHCTSWRLDSGELPPQGVSTLGCGLSPRGPAVRVQFHNVHTCPPHPPTVSYLREGLLSFWVGDLESWGHQGVPVHLLWASCLL